MRRTWQLLLSLALLPWASMPAAATPLARHVVVIALDGCRPELLREHSDGPLRQLWEEGAYTWQAEAALPSVTQVNFAGILTSTTPAKHGIDQVKWDATVIPRVRATTIFEVLAAHRQSAVALLGHEKLYPVETEASGAKFLHSPHGAKTAAPLAARTIREERPAFTFVYFGDLDGAGHQFGWLSPEQIAAMSRINAGVAEVMSAIEATAPAETVVIVTSDHGGLGKSHSTGRPEDRAIPWTIWGPGVKRGPIPRQSRPVYNYDTAATALYVLGITPPAEWDGRVVRVAFGK